MTGRADENDMDHRGVRTWERPVVTRFAAADASAGEGSPLEADGQTAKS